jgi:hypothetical protein
VGEVNDAITGVCIFAALRTISEDKRPLVNRTLSLVEIFL